MAFNITATLPTITATAMGSQRNPQFGFMYTQPVDGSGVPNVVGAQQQNGQVLGTLLTVTGTATGTQTSGAQTNITGKGANLFLNISNISASSTVALNVQSQDPASMNWITIYRTSLDQIQTGGIQTNLVQIYPGVTSVAQANMFLDNAHLGLAFRGQVSITSGTTSGNVPNISYTLSVVSLY